MDHRQVEKAEHPDKTARDEVEKAQAKLRAMERSKSIERASRKELTMEDLKPNATYEKNGYTYRIDADRHPVEVSGKLKLKTAERTPQQGEIGKMGLPGDEGGHIIGVQFDGPSDAFNIRPQNEKINRKVYGELEREWKKALKERKEKVQVDIKLRYGDGSIRPDRYIVTSWIDGKQQTSRFPNHA